MTTTEKPNMLLALAALWASRPRPNTDPIVEAEQAAAWYREKSRVHEQFAEQLAERGLLAEQATEQQHAAAALEHACRLLIEAEVKRAKAAAAPVVEVSAS